MAMVAGKKPPASTPYLAQRRDGALSPTIGCSTWHWFDLQFVVEDTWPFRQRASEQNGRLNPLRMDTTTEAGALFDNHPRLKNKALLLDITIVNPSAGSNLGNAARHEGNTSPTQSSGRKTSIGARSPLPTPSFLSLCRHVVTLAQTCMPSSRSSPSDGYSTGRRHTPMSPNIWRKGQK